MATSTRDLIDTLESHARCAPATERQAHDAAGALGVLGRALRRLADDGLDAEVNGPRERIAAELAQSCMHYAAASATDRVGRLTDVASGIADAIGATREETDRDQRWAITVELARAVRVLTTYPAQGEDRHIDDLVWTHRSARALIIHALQDSPAPQDRAALDRALPRTTLPADLPASQVALESLSVISDRLRRCTTGFARRPTLPEVFAITRAAQSTATYATSSAAALTGQPLPRARPAVAIWREVRDRLHPFTTTAPLTVDDQDLGLWAQRAHTGLRLEFGAAHQPEIAALGGLAVKTTAVRQLQAMINEIPAIADHLALSIQQLADHGELHALAHKLPFREQRVEEYLARRGVVADRFDIIVVLDRLGDAATLATELAVTLDHATGPSLDQPQPDPLAVNAIAARPDPHAVLADQRHRGPDAGTELETVIAREPAMATASPLLQIDLRDDVDNDREQAAPEAGIA